MNDKITLILPDIHHKCERAERIIKSEGADEVILLGDYFDDFNDTPEQVTETCEWLSMSVNKPNRIHLFGNHDTHYAYNYGTFKCSGFEQWKKFIVDDTVPRDVWEKLKWFHVLDNTWLITHAGLHNTYIPKEIIPLLSFHKDRPLFFNKLENFLNEEIEEGFKSAANNIPHWILNAGACRGGRQRFGGITWCDFQQELSPFIGLNQICGHTPNRTVRWKCLRKGSAADIPNTNGSGIPELNSHNDLSHSTNVCLDTHLMHYAIWNGKELVIKNYINI